MYTVIGYNLRTNRLKLAIANINNLDDLGSGDIIMPYDQLEDGEAYQFDLYYQPRYIEPVLPGSRDRFDLEYTVRKNNLRLVARELFTSDTIEYHAKETEPSIPMKPGLESKQKKYCWCVLKVAAKGEVRNPYAVCANSTHTSSRECGKYYDWERMSDRYLQVYAGLKKGQIPIPSPYDRRQMLSNIYQWKQTHT